MRHSFDAFFTPHRWFLYRPLTNLCTELINAFGTLQRYRAAIRHPRTMILEAQLPSIAKEKTGIGDNAATSWMVDAVRND